jgi:hypothetical protein
MSDIKEQAKRIDTLKESANLVLDPDAYKGRYDLNKESITQYLTSLKNQAFHNAEVPVAIKLSTRTIKKLTSTGMSDTEYMKSLAYIPIFAEKALLITAEDPIKDHYHHYRRYYHLVTGALISENLYTVHVVIGERNGGWYYHQNLTKIEKGSLIDTIQRTKPGYQTSLSDIKDITLVKILQEPFAKKTQNSEKNYEN